MNPLFTRVVDAAKEGNLPEALTQISDFTKSQNVRSWDFLVLGPAMIFWGLKGSLGPIERLALMGAGVGTIAYNYQNFRKNKLVDQTIDFLSEQVPTENGMQGLG